jgi:hypothetical protein
VHDRHACYVSRLKRLGQINNHGSGLVRSLARIHLQVIDQAVNEVLGAGNESAVPVLRRTDLESDSRNAVVYPCGFNTPGLARVDFDDIGLCQLGKTLDTGQGEVGVCPQRAV